MGAFESKPSKEKVEMKAENAKVTFPGVDDAIKIKEEGNLLLNKVCDLAISKTIDNTSAVDLAKDISKLLIDYLVHFAESDQNGIELAIKKCKLETLWSEFKSEIKIIKERLEAIRNENAKLDYDIQFSINRCGVLLEKLNDNLHIHPLAIAVIFNELFFVYAILCVAKARIEQKNETFQQLNKIGTFVDKLQDEVIKQRMKFIKKVEFRALHSPSLNVGLPRVLPRPRWGYEDKFRDDMKGMKTFADDLNDFITPGMEETTRKDKQVKMYKEQLEKIYKAYFQDYKDQLYKMKDELSH